VAAALAAARWAGAGLFAGTALGAAVAVVVLTASLWWTNAGLLRQLGDDVRRLLGRRSAVVRA
jgi:hypothetical protein